MPPSNPTLSSNTAGGEERRAHALRKHSVTIAARTRTSISMPDDLWTEFKKIATERRELIGELVFAVGSMRGEKSLSRAVREFTQMQMVLAAALALSAPIAADDFDRCDMLVYGDEEP